jgi:hypothetical protein
MALSIEYSYLFDKYNLRYLYLCHREVELHFELKTV